jgi:hypothetical protein
MKDLEDVIEKGSFYRVNLSTRITQDTCNKLAEIQGWLQTERELSTVSKQEAIEKAIRHYHEFILQTNCMQDESKEEQSTVIVMQEASKPKARHYDLDAYREMSKYNGGGW